MLPLKGNAKLQQILRVGRFGHLEDDTVSVQDVITKECILQDPKTRSIGSICDCSWRPVCRRRKNTMLSKQPFVFPACWLVIPVLELIYWYLDVFWYKVAQFMLCVYRSSRGQINNFNFVQTDVVISANPSKTYVLLINLMWTQALITIS